MRGIHTILRNKKASSFYVILLRPLHIISYAPKLTFSFFLSISGGCFAVTLWGVRTASPSANSTVRPFGCTGNKKYHIIKLLSRSMQRFICRKPYILQSNPTSVPKFKVFVHQCYLRVGRLMSLMFSHIYVTFISKILYHKFSYLTKVSVPVTKIMEWRQLKGEWNCLQFDHQLTV